MTAEAPRYLPSPADVAFYQEHGWWISPPVVTDELLDTLRFGVERYYAGERDTPLLTRLTTDWTPADGDILRQNDYVSLQIDELRQFVLDVTLPAIAGALSGGSQIRLFHDQLVYKPPGAAPADSEVGWHSDRAYWKTCTSHAMLTAWVPLADVTEETGTLVMIDGSHRWGTNDQRKTFHVRDTGATRDDARHRAGDWREVPCVMKAGQVSFHHCQTIHGSYANRSARPRLAWALHYQDGDNRYQENRRPDGVLIPHLNDVLCRRDAAGRPDYSDPDICPLLWSRAP